MQLSFCIIIIIKMKYLKAMCKFLKQNEELNDFFEVVRDVVAKNGGLKTQSDGEKFQKSLEFIVSELKKLNLSKLQELLSKIPQVPHTTAYIIKVCEEFTAALIILPDSTFFNWHDHLNMYGISHCLNGTLSFKSINPSLLQKVHIQKYLKNGQQINQNLRQQQGQFFSYPIDQIKQEKIDEIKSPISLVTPHQFNIHQIKSISGKQSAFIDILLPQYPDNVCNYYETVQDQSISVENLIFLKKIKQQKDKIIGIQELVTLLKKKNVKRVPVNS